MIRLNTYYDVCPWSPSGRYLAVTRFPFQDKIARLGDIAEASVIHLHQQTIRSVYRTKAWGYQLGAMLEWGSGDRFLYANDVLDLSYPAIARRDEGHARTTVYVR